MPALNVMHPESSAEIQVENSVSRTKVDMTKLKAFAAKELLQTSLLRQILLLESDTLEISAFLSRLPIWLQLLKLERRPY